MTGKLQFLYLLRPTRADMLRAGPTEREAAIVAEHFAYLQRLVAEGVVLMAGRTLEDDETTFGVTIFRADSLELAGEIMRGDPAVAQGVMTAQLFPFHVALWSHAGPGGSAPGG